MSIALRRIRDRIRMRIRETDSRRAGFDVVELDNYIAETYLELQARLPAPDLYTASGLTIAAGQTFTLPATVSQYTGNDGGAEYAGAVRIRLTSDGRFLTKLTTEELDRMRDGDVNNTGSKPRWFALWEEKDQDVQGRCWPPAAAAEVCDIFVRLAADDVRDFVGSGTDDLDDVEILFSRGAATALINHVAADLLEMMTDEDLKLRRLNPRIVPKWRKDAEIALYQEAKRRHDLAGVARTMRNIA